MDRCVSQQSEASMSCSPIHLLAAITRCFRAQPGPESDQTHDRVVDAFFGLGPHVLRGCCCGSNSGRGSIVTLSADWKAHPPGSRAVSRSTAQAPLGRMYRRGYDSLHAPADDVVEVDHRWLPGNEGNLVVREVAQDRRV